MPSAKTAALWTELTLEERRERRRLRRVKQREDNVKRGAKMHAARLKSEANGAKRILQHKQSIFVGCSAGATRNGGARSMTVCHRMTGSAIT
ncbi:hypothetical protein [Bradyrhizobium sp. McL0615]|uniref:hypothetical protein n=1 Tax=Bradyrhizobium sp. McL0615 TaxID=3415673 RepID=UPI003CF6AC12